MLVVSCSGGLSSVWGDASKAGSQIVFCTCALQPDDNSSSDRSFAGFVLLFVTQREIPALDSLFFSRPGHTSLSPMFSTPLPRPPAIAPEISSTPKGFQATVIPSRARSLLRPAAGISSRSTTTISFANALNPSPDLSCCFELWLHGTVLYVTQGNTHWSVQF